MAAGLLMAAGCADNQETAHYDPSISPVYSAGRMSDFNGPHAAVSSPVMSAAASASGKSATQSDNAIVASVRESLRRNAEIAPIVSNVQISANNGAVLLNGSVQSEEQKRQIEAIAQQATGVVAINNQLQVFSSPSPRETDTGNQPVNPLLNPTSVGGNNPPAIYQNTGRGAQNSNSNAVNQTAQPGGAGKIHQDQPNQNGQAETTNSDQSTEDSPMH